MGSLPKWSWDMHVQRAGAMFHARFGRQARYAAVAPGRVNLIGEHTDYNGGFVLPIALELQTVVVGDRAAGDQVCLVSTSSDEPVRFDMATVSQPVANGWGRYVQGVLAGMRERGLDAGGFDAVVDSTVPLGAGLSSSASLTVAMATLAEPLTGGELDPLDKANLCQRAERDFAGVPCGLMDPLVGVVGRRDRAVLIDCRSQTWRLIPLEGAAVRVLVVDSGVRRNLADGRYAARRRQCEAAAASMGVPYLCEASIGQLDAAKTGLDAESFRRARHVLTENDRTVQAADALEVGDYQRFGELMYASHASLRHDFEVSCTELDLLVKLAAELGADRGVYGARMTGGGFGGCVICLVRADCAADVAAVIRSTYAERTGVTPHFMITQPADGARMIPI